MSTESYNSDIAIIGMSGRFPKANTLAQFWQNLAAGVEAISFFTDEELTAIDPTTLADPAYVRAGAVLDGIKLFDASFFGLTPKEAEILDPQQRFFMECAWETLEIAGYDGQAYDGPIGVFAASSLSFYLFNLAANPRLLKTLGSAQVIIGNDKDHLSTRVAYKLNLRGPVVTVQTA